MLLATRYALRSSRPSSSSFTSPSLALITVISFVLEDVVSRNAFTTVRLSVSSLFDFSRIVSQLKNICGYNGVEILPHEKEVVDTSKNQYVKKS